MLIENGFEILVTSTELFSILAVFSVLAVPISKAGFGGALGSLSVPILLFVIPPKQAIGILLPLFLVIDIWVVYIWRNMLVKRILLVMCLFGIFGQILGWILFDLLNYQMLTGLIGVIALITAFNYAWRRLWPMEKT